MDDRCMQQRVVTIHTGKRCPVRASKVARLIEVASEIWPTANVRVNADGVQVVVDDWKI